MSRPPRAVIDLDALRHSRVGYPRPMHPRLDLLHAMFDAAEAATAPRRHP